MLKRVPFSKVPREIWRAFVYSSGSPTLDFIIISPGWTSSRLLAAPIHPTRELPIYHSIILRLAYATRARSSETRRESRGITANPSVLFRLNLFFNVLNRNLCLLNALNDVTQNEDAENENSFSQIRRLRV